MKKADRPQIAIFDMDRTLTRRGTFTPFLIFVASRRQSWRFLLLPLFLLAMLGYVLRLIDRKGLKELGFRLLIGQKIGAPTLQALAAAFADHIVARGLHNSAMSLLHNAKGDDAILVLATASPDFYATEIAARLGFDAVIATQQMRDEAGHILATIKGHNCYGMEKRNYIARWFEQTERARAAFTVFFYSDDASDLPSLEWADKGFAVNPSFGFARLANQKGIEIVQLV